MECGLSPSEGGAKPLGMVDFALNGDLDPAVLAERFRAEGRLQITGILRHGGAMALFRELAESRAWRLAINIGDRTEDYSHEEVAAWPPDRAAALDRAVVNAGRNAFQFRYETIRLPEYGTGAEGETPPLLRRFTEFMCSDEVVDFMRALTGAGDIAFADAHASRYTAGHFLTAHDDRNDGMNRRAAYVLNLTPQWRPDWGGLLQFYDERGNVARGFTPGFNLLNIFTVPQPHSVTWVTPLAGAPRHAVTGWLRAGMPA